MIAFAQVKRTNPPSATARARYFKDSLPASTFVQVAGLVRPGLLLEIEVVAVPPPRQASTGCSVCLTFYGASRTQREWDGVGRPTRSTRAAKRWSERRPSSIGSKVRYGM